MLFTNLPRKPRGTLSVPGVLIVFRYPPVNMAIQYESRQFTDDEKESIVMLREFREFLNSTSNRFD
jgi:hypothetical protein